MPIEWSAAKFLVGALALASACQAQRGTICAAEPKAKTPPRLRCGMEGFLKSPGTPLTPDTSVTPNFNNLKGITATERCFNSCWSTSGCVSFAVNDETEECTLYDKKIIQMKSRKRQGTGVFLYNTDCFTVTSTAWGLPNHGFEDSAESSRWYTRHMGSLTYTADDVYEGRQAALLEATTQWAYLENADTGLCDGVEYKISFAYKILSLGECSAPTIQGNIIRRVSSASWPSGTAIKQLTSDDLDQWQVMDINQSGPFTAGSSFSYEIDMLLYNGDDGESTDCPGIKALIDDVQINPVPRGQVPEST